ncbi:unnamed protein product [Rotaria sordida]|uniref:Mos1 transposase HTH domain-containing protein n=1 Tax=Rotaria sordida TaxID=392033 RepID=A0A819ZFC6_9BILA|nr:unnamed protein product [Rotaria sordida]CAF4173369.1 unnamed protein product [Rotaria sordida]
MDKLRIRSCIKTHWLLGLTATQVHDELTAGYRPDAVAYSTVTHWVYRFSIQEEKSKVIAHPSYLPGPSPSDF